AILLDHGQAVFQGAAVEAVKRYYLLQQGQAAEVAGERKATRSVATINDGDFQWPCAESQFQMLGTAQVSNGAATCTRVALTDDDGRLTTDFEKGAEALFWFEFETHEDIGVPLGGLTIHNDKGIIVHGKG